MPRCRLRIGILVCARQVDPIMTRLAVGTFGVFGLFQQWKEVTASQLRDIEALGYGAIWAGGSPPAELDWVEFILESTETLKVATGVVNIWSAAPGPVAESFHRIEAAHPGRFLLGLGVGHPELIAEYKKPYDALTGYLAKLDEYGVPKERRVVAALGPQVLKLAGRRSAGAHAYLTTPLHTARARTSIGPDAFIAPAHKVVLTADTGQARAIGREALGIYLKGTNYVNNWRRLGFTDSDVAAPGSDALIDALVAYGNTDAVAARLKEHLAAGASHVPVQVLTGADNLIPALAQLAGPLGLN